MPFIVDGTNGGFFPSWTTATRPASPAAGQVGYNTTTASLEVYNGSNWQTVESSGTSTSYNVQYLVVAGGGGGGQGAPGGGGGGGMIEGSQAVTVGTGYTATVGAGGAIGVNGSNSVFGSVTATGGGYGGGGGTPQGNTGGSGGGSGQSSAAYGTRSVDNQGSNGGAGNGGGGGAGGPGQNGYGSYSGVGIFPSNGQGGMGRASSISGQTIYYAGGGSGYFTNISGSPIKSYAQSGGGGDGFSSTVPRVNSGGGGYADQSAGGSGIVVIAYAGPQRGTGGTVTSVGGNTIHTFTSSGTFTA